MGLLRSADILQATRGRLISGGDTAFGGVSIDSRTIRQGDLFVALRGERFDGHDFLQSALDRASGALVDRPVDPVAGKTIIAVSDTLSALQDLARTLRAGSGAMVAAVVGTNGKTTTKELTASILGQRRKVLKTAGNLNNHIGLPLCIANMSGDETVMVLEMGSNAGGDIRLLCGIGRPDYAVVTNVGAAHLEGFGSIEAVRRTDLEVLDFARTVAVNADDVFLMEGLAGYTGKVVAYGIDRGAAVSARSVEAREQGMSFVLAFADGRETGVNLRLHGRFNVYNALAAAAITDAMGAGLEDIRAGLESFGGVPLRLEVKKVGGAVAISDVYNANPASMEAALQELVRLRKGRCIAVLGDMLELGAYSEEAHSALVRRLAEERVDVLIAVGPEMKRAAADFVGDCHLAGDSAEAGEILRRICRPGDTVLVKGSRGMRMERVLAAEGPAARQEGSHAI